MGKIRVKTLGDEEQEKVDQKKAAARAEAKKAKEVAAANNESSEDPEQSRRTPSESNQTQEASTAKTETKKKKKAKFAKTKKQTHSTAFLALAAKIDHTKTYKLQEALALLPSLQLSKFDETVELHINTTNKGISGNVVLPHGNGKTTRVEIVDQSADATHVEDVIKKIEAGQIDFDILIATPDSMPKLAKIARVLGPKGLMPNPKTGTVTPKPQDAAKKFEGGQMNFKTEAKFPLMHLSVGKVSFGEKKLAENIQAAVVAISNKNIKKVTLKSTMSPGLKIDVSSF